MKTRPCRKCNGTGKEIDQFATGQELRKLREFSEKSLREVAKLLKISAPYLSDLELGRRDWNEDKIEEYKEALKA